MVERVKIRVLLRDLAELMEKDEGYTVDLPYLDHDNVRFKFKRHESGRRNKNVVLMDGPNLDRQGVFDSDYRIEIYD